jgi:hypothetical protein
MTSKNSDIEKIFEQAIEGIRGQAIESAQVRDAADRVWARVAQEAATSDGLELGAKIREASRSDPGMPSPENVPKPALRGCPDFQALFSDYLRSRRDKKHHLAESDQGTGGSETRDSRFVLLEDHLRCCVDCRKAFHTTQSEMRQVLPFRKKEKHPLFTFSRTRWAWGIAAAFLVGVGLAQLAGMITLFGNRASLARIEQVEGGLYGVTREAVTPLMRDAVLHEGEVMRTAKASGAMIRLNDGSLIELSPRTELHLSKKWNGVAIHLDRGNVIVQAAQQRWGRLELVTPDCLVSVKGTVFSVNQGLKGARVSVIEGEVQVDQGKQQTMLHPGQQLTTSPSLGRASIDSEIAWSRNVLKYSALLQELKSVKDQLEKAGLVPGLRYSSRLLPLLPPETVVFGAIPNISKTLSEGRRLLEERIQQNAALGQWREEITKASRGGPQLEEILEKVRVFGEYLGDEIVFAVPMDKTGHYRDFLLLVEVTRTSGFQSFLQAEVEKLNATAKGQPALRIVEKPELLPQEPTRESQQKILLYYTDGIFAVSPSAAELQRVSATLKGSPAQLFSGTEFYARLSECYKDGVGWLFGLDMKRLVTQDTRRAAEGGGSETAKEMLNLTGILNLKHLIVEHKESQGKTENMAALSFDEPRRGLTSWLAPPGPMGSLNFVSPDANLVAAFVVKNPALLIDDLFNILGSKDSSFQQRLEEFQSKHGVNVRDDLAAPLGGEFAFALDGPVLPKPSWKMVVEVNDPARLQKTMEWAVEELNREAASAGKPALQLEQTQSNGRSYYRLSSSRPGVEMNYLFVDGYLLAAPSRVLLDQAIQFRATGYVLSRSDTFTKLLPQDGRSDFSAVIYQNLAPLLKPLSGILGNAASTLSDEQRKTIETLAADTPPTLIYACAEEKRIVLASSGDLSYLGLSLRSLMFLGDTANRTGLQAD